LKIKLLALAFEALIELGFEDWFQEGCGLDQFFPSVFEISAKFPWRKFGSLFSCLKFGNASS